MTGNAAPSPVMLATESEARNAQIKMCGNGVVRQQARLAVDLLVPYAPTHVLEYLGISGERAA